MVQSSDILGRSDEQAGGIERRQRTFVRMAWRHLLSKPLGSLGLLVVLAVAVIAIFADLIAPFLLPGPELRSRSSHPRRHPPVGQLHPHRGRPVLPRVRHRAPDALVGRHAHRSGRPVPEDVSLDSHIPGNRPQGATVLGFAFAGDALRDILDPRQLGR